MANIRELKKDIKYLVSELLTQVYLKQGEIDKKDEDKVVEIMVETLQMHNEFIARASHPDGKDNPEIVKAYYKKLRNDVLDTTAKLFERIGKL